jgi:hypothetical protein
VGLDRFFSSIIYVQWVGLLGRGISPSQGRYIHTECLPIVILLLANPHEIRPVSLRETRCQQLLRRPSKKCESEYYCKYRLKRLRQAQNLVRRLDFVLAVFCYHIVVVHSYATSAIKPHVLQIHKNNYNMHKRYFFFFTSLTPVFSECLSLDLHTDTNITIAQIDRAGLRAGRTRI